MLAGIRGVNAYAAALLRFSRLSTDFSVRVLRALAWPRVELLIRLWLAQIYFASGGGIHDPLRRGAHAGSRAGGAVRLPALRQPAVLGGLVRLVRGVRRGSDFRRQHAAPRTRRQCLARNPPHRAFHRGCAQSLRAHLSVGGASLTGHLTVVGGAPA